MMSNGRLHAENASQILSSPSPTSRTPNDIPLTVLRDDLVNRRISCSVYELIRLHTRCWKDLPETAKSGHGSEHNDLIETTSRLVKSSYASILDLLPEESGARAIIDGTSGKSLSMRMWEEDKPSTEVKPATARDYETCGYVISGKAELHFDNDQKVLLSTGDSWIVPKGAKHTYKILETLTAIEATHPPAEVKHRDAPVAK